MNSSSNPQSVFELPLAFSYRDVAAPARVEKAPTAPQAAAQPAEPGIPPQEVEALINRARAEALTEAQQRFHEELATRTAAQEDKILRTLDQFAEHQKNYFARLESEVVQLALAIAARILHREAQTDPMLVTGLVHVALEKMQNGSSVTIRVTSADVDKWREYTDDLRKDLNITVAPDPDMQANDCTIETDLGSADFSIDAQLKEVEQGFFDLLALRPQSK